MSTRRLRHGGAPGLAVLLALALLPTAVSAKPFTPELAVTIDPATTDQPARISTTITQTSEEEAARTAKVTIPEGFGVPVSNLTSLPVCTAEQATAQACAEPTRIGSAEATASIFGLLSVPLSGSVHWGGPTGDGRFAIRVLLQDELFGLHLLITGLIAPVESGGFETTFDALPNLTTTRFKLTFDGGDRAILLTPATCGVFRFRGVFTGHGEQLVEAFAPVRITGCASRATTFGRVRGTRTSLRLAVTSPATIRVRVFRDHDDRLVFDERVNARAGTATLRFERALPPARYRVTLKASAPGTTTVTKKALFRVRRPQR